VSYNDAIKNFAPAQMGDIEAYRKWMEENAPIAKLETRFLNHEQDLLALSRRSPAPARSINLRQASVVLCILVLLPLLAFTVVSAFFARLVVLLVVGFAGLAVASSSSMDLDHVVPVQDFAWCVSM